MQKRLLALVATVAMVLSMFAGVVFAAPAAWDLYVAARDEANTLLAADNTPKAYQDGAWTTFKTASLKLDLDEFTSDTDLGVATAAINDAISTLETKKLTATYFAYQADLAGVKALVRTDYTPESWSSFTASLPAEITDDTTDDSSLQAAIDSIATARGKLLSTSVFAEYEARVDAHKALVEAEYTADSWTAYTAATTSANLLLTEASTNALVGAENTTLREAKELLVTPAQHDAIYDDYAARVETVKAWYVGTEWVNPGQYTDASWDGFKAAISGVDLTLTKTAATSDLVTQEDKIATAHGKLVPKSSAYLNYKAEVAEVEAIGGVNTKYTAKSWDEYLAAIVNCNLRLTENEADVTLVVETQKITAAIGKLREIGSSADVSFYNGLVAQVEALKEADWTKVSWVAFQQAKNGCDLTLTAADSQEAINAEIVKIQAALLLLKPEVTGKVVLDKKEFVLGEAIRLSGKVVDAKGDLIKQNFRLSVDELMFDQADAWGNFDGVADLQFPGDFAFGGVIDSVVRPLPVRDGRHNYEAPICPGVYTLRATSETTGAVYTIKFVIADNLEADKDLGFTWGIPAAGEKFVYQNRLPYGVNATAVRLVLKNADGDVSATYAGSLSGSSFYFSIPKTLFPHAGELVIEYQVTGRWIPVVKGEIAPAEVGFEVSPEAAIYESSTPVTFEVTTLDENLYVPVGKTVKWTYKIVNTAKATETLANTGAIVEKIKQVSVYPTDKDYGKTWKATVIGTIDGEVCFEAEAPFRVVRPDQYNLIGLPEVIELKQRGEDITPFDKIWATYYDANTKTFKYANGYEIAAKGAGITSFAWDSIDDAGTKAILLPKNGGEIEVTVKAYEDALKTKLIATFDQKITVKAGKLTVEPASVARNKAQDVVLTLVDVEDKEVNNAYIFVTKAPRLATATTPAFVFKKADAKVDPEKTNIRGGVYTVKLTAAQLADAGTFNVYAIVNDKVTGEQTWMAVSTLKVLGDNVYDVSVNTEDVLAGQKTAAVITVKDADGKYVKPTAVKLNYGKKSVAIAVGAASGNGYKVTIPAINFGGEAKLVASTAGGNSYGETTIEVVKPKLVVDVEKVTNQVNSKFTFKLVDPRTEEEVVLPWDVVIEAEYAEYYTVQKWDYVGKALRDIVFNKQTNVAQLLGSEKEHQMLFLLNADYRAAEDDEATPRLVFTAKKDGEVTLDTEIEIGKATLTPDPVNPIAGRDNKVVFTLADANGNPLADYKLYRAHFMDAELAKTNEDGQYEYVARMDGVESFAAELDLLLKDELTGKKQYGLVTAQIVPGYDTEKPTVTYEVDGAAATLVITDNVTLVRVQIDGKDLDLWAGSKLEHKVALKPGLNKFVVKAQDSAGNVLEETVEITAEAVVLQGEQVKRQGEFVFVQLRQFKDLGAEIGWDAATKTATFIVGETKVEVVIGSLTAKVNGEAVKMPVAPFIANDRTYVPTRFIAEQLGWNVHWAAGDIITITLP